MGISLVLDGVEDVEYYNDDDFRELLDRVAQLEADFQREREELRGLIEAQAEELRELRAGAVVQVEPAAALRLPEWRARQPLWVHHHPDEHRGWSRALPIGTQVTFMYWSQTAAEGQAIVQTAQGEQWLVPAEFLSTHRVHDFGPDPGPEGNLEPPQPHPYLPGWEPGLRLQVLVDNPWNAGLVQGEEVGFARWEPMTEADWAAENEAPTVYTHCAFVIDADGNDWGLRVEDLTEEWPPIYHTDRLEVPRWEPGQALWYRGEGEAGIQPGEELRFDRWERYLHETEEEPLTRYRFTAGILRLGPDGEPEEQDGWDLLVEELSETPLPAEGAAQPDLPNQRGFPDWIQIGATARVATRAPWQANLAVGEEVVIVEIRVTPARPGWETDHDHYLVVQEHRGGPLWSIPIEAVAPPTEDGAAAPEFQIGQELVFVGETQINGDPFVPGLKLWVSDPRPFYDDPALLRVQVQVGHTQQTYYVDRAYVRPYWEEGAIYRVLTPRPMGAPVGIGDLVSMVARDDLHITIRIQNRDHPNRNTVYFVRPDDLERVVLLPEG